MAYVILVNDDDSLYGSKKCRIMQRQKLVNDLIFVVNPIYRNTHDMTKASVLLEYVLPISKDYKTVYLELSDELYNEEFLQYKLPFDTNITSEHGDVELQLTFAYAEMNENGDIVQRIRKTDKTTVKITPISKWSDLIPDQALSGLDQRLIVMNAQIQALDDLTGVLNEKKVDNLVYNEKEDVIHLSANGTVIGDKVSVRKMLDDGVPVVDLNADSENGSDKEHENNCDCGCDCGDNVVEFGYSPDTSKPTIEDSDIVEF